MLCLIINIFLVISYSHETDLFWILVSCMTPLGTEHFFCSFRWHFETSMIFFPGLKTELPTLSKDLKDNPEIYLKAMSVAFHQVF